MLARPEDVYLPAGEAPTIGCPAVGISVADGHDEVDGGPVGDAYVMGPTTRFAGGSVPTDLAPLIANIVERVVEALETFGNLCQAGGTGIHGRLAVAPGGRQRGVGEEQPDEPIDVPLVGECGIGVHQRANGHLVVPAVIRTLPTHGATLDSLDDFEHERCSLKGAQPGCRGNGTLRVVVKVEIWSDVVCPWCAIGKRRFDQALERFDHRDEVEVVWRSFELDPGAPPVRDGVLVDHLAHKYGMSRDQAEASQARLTTLAEVEGLEFNFDQAQGGNTFHAHRLLQFAASQGVQAEMGERLFQAYFRDGRAIGTRAVLREVGIESGLDPAMVDEVLDSGAFTEEVRADEVEANELGVSGVPFFVIDRRYGLAGAQPTELLLEVLETAWAEREPAGFEAVVGAADGSCEDDSCGM